MGSLRPNKKPAPRGGATARSSLPSDGLSRISSTPALRSRGTASAGFENVSSRYPPSCQNCAPKPISRVRSPCLLTTRIGLDLGSFASDHIYATREHLLALGVA